MPESLLYVAKMFYGVMNIRFGYLNIMKKVCMGSTDHASPPKKPHSKLQSTKVKLNGLGSILALAQLLKFMAISL